MKNFNSYNENGVNILLRENIETNEVDIKYNGLLANSGADSVYLHAGYACCDKSKNWDNIMDVKMDKTGCGCFEATIPLEETKKSLSFVFKDSANNWDNNCGKNYSLELHTIQ